MKEIKFNEKLSELRKKCKLTQSKVAEEINISPKSISKWECGVDYPSVEYIKKLEKLYNTEKDYLLNIYYKENNISSDIEEKEDKKYLLHIILNGVSLAMGISLVLLNLFDKIEVNESINLIGIAILSLSIANITEKK